LDADEQVPAVPLRDRWPGTGRHLGQRARFDRVRWGRMPRKDAYQCYYYGGQVWPVSTTG